MQKKQVVRILIQFLVIILLLELFLRVIFYQQSGRETLAILETAKNIKRKFTATDHNRIYEGFLLARPDSGNEVNRLITEEAFASNRFEYSPWTEYKNIDFSGKYINTKGLIRATVPDISASADSAAMHTIYFFGGSTMFGVNITDRETIASAFVSEYKAQFPGGISIKVVNYGLPANYSYNELMLLSHLVYSGQQPGSVIMLDGLNNFLMASASLKRFPYYYYRLKQAGKEKFSLKEMNHISDSTLTLFKYPPGYSEDSLTGTLVDNYLSDIEHVKKLGYVNNFKTFFFIQPNPFFNYPNQKNDPICDKQHFPVVGKAYTLLEKKIAGNKSHFFLGNMLADEKGYPFIDRFHYSPLMCRKIAKEIVKVVGDSINKSN